MLHLHGSFRCQKHRIAVYGRLELHALFAQLSHRREREHLESTGIRQYRSVPVHEFMKAAMLADYFGAGPQHQVERVAENNLGPAGSHLFGCNALHRAVGSHRHERGCLHRAATEFERATARRARSMDDRELHSSRPGVRNIASP